MREKPDGGASLKIVDQVRTAQAREYDLACGEGRLTVNVQAREPGWRVEVRGKRRGGETITASESRPTRVDALRAAGKEWETAARPYGLNMFDFAAVEVLLVGVRAL